MNNKEKIQYRLELTDVLNETDNLLINDEIETLQEGIGSAILVVILLPYVIGFTFVSIFSIIHGIKSKLIKGKLRKGKKFVEFNKIPNYHNIDKFIDAIGTVRYEKNIFNWMDEYVKYKNFALDKIENILQKFKIDASKGHTGDYSFMEEVTNKYSKSIAMILEELEPPSIESLDKNKDNWITDEDPTLFKNKLKDYFNNLNKLYKRSEKITEIITSIEEEFHRYYSGYEYGDIYNEQIIYDLYGELLDERSKTTADDIFKYIEVKGKKK